MTCRTAHPRVGGEDGVGYTPEEVLDGSPPRRRGRPIPVPVDPRARGLTPRVGGEDIAGTLTRFQYRGSPPRRRGRPRIDGA